MKVIIPVDNYLHQNTITIEKDKLGRLKAVILETIPRQADNDHIVCWLILDDDKGDTIEGKYLMVSEDNHLYLCNDQDQ